MDFFRSSKQKPSTEAPTSEKEPVHDPILIVQNDYQPVPAPTMDDSQVQKLGQLRDHIKTIMLPESDDYYSNEKGFLTDATLHRYMRARKWDYEAAKTMLENTIHWRRDFKPDLLDPDYIRPEADTGKMYYNGFDKAGRPLWIMRPRHQNSKDGERQIKHIVFCLERGIRLMPPGVETIDIIIDFKGAMASHHPSLATSKKFLEILSNHYPERLGYALIVKSPWFFLTSFKLISPFIDPVTRAKIKFVVEQRGDNADGKRDASELAYLPDYIPEDQIETEFHGDRPFVFDIDTYWSRLLEVTGDPHKVIDY
ncbi:CRAL-TRIO domain-containing protein [Chlamydoabsidia padenii]|nr:CRAL-TRIO domain-containing protein [Chlamydoabsidia padenii]